MPFEPEIIAEIAVISRGNPRVINALCDNALILAFADAKETVSLQHVHDAAADLDLRSLRVHPVGNDPVARNDFHRPMTLERYSTGSSGPLFTRAERFGFSTTEETA
jgi:hypothetical protein